MRIRSLFLPVAAALIVAVAALALGHSRPGASVAPTSAVASGKTAQLRIAGYAFAPAALTVKVGTTVTITNADSTEHTATSGSGGFDSGSLKPGQAGHFTLTKAGAYNYICQFHAFMNGTIRVVN